MGHEIDDPEELFGDEVAERPPPALNVGASGDSLALGHPVGDDRVLEAEEDRRDADPFDRPAARSKRDGREDGERYRGFKVVGAERHGNTTQSVASKSDASVSPDPNETFRPAIGVQTKPSPSK